MHQQKADGSDSSPTQTPTFGGRLLTLKYRDHPVSLPQKSRRCPNIIKTAYPMYVVKATNQDKTGSCFSWLELVLDADFTAAAAGADDFDFEGILNLAMLASIQPDHTRSISFSA